jgi:hypothetical protein
MKLNLSRRQEHRNPLRFAWMAACLIVGLSFQLQSQATDVDQAPTVLNVEELKALERSRVLARAEVYLQAAPETVTAFRAQRSAGGIHDFYSEGDYWWPDPDNPDGPYIRRDGVSNPENFVKHRHAMVRLSSIIGALTSAYLITGESRYAAHAGDHLAAWFIDPATKMDPSLNYGQAIKGKVVGRSIGIIDTIHLVEVARGAQILGELGALAEVQFEQIKSWFSDYLEWLTTHPFGQRERNHPNNHGVCWSMQVAAFAQLTGWPGELEWVRKQFKTVYLQDMMALDGSFPAELGRTKPYGYSLFVLDAMAMVAQIASTPEDDLWTYKLPDGRSIELGLRFLFPYIKDKSTWPYGRDAQYWDEWPVRHPSLLFGGLRLNEPEYLAIWKSLEPDPATPEVLRNLPIRYPLLWVNLD